MQILGKMPHSGRPGRSLCASLGLLPSISLAISWFLALVFSLPTQIRAQTAGAAIPVGVNPQAMALNTVTNKIYVADVGTSLAPGTTVTVVDTITARASTVTVGNSPDAVAVNPFTDKVYVANDGDGTVTVLDGSTNEPLATVIVGQGPVAMAVNPVTDKIYVVNDGGGSVTVVDGATDTPQSTIQVGTNPVSIAVNSVTNRIYVANSNSSTLTVIDGANDQATTVALSVTTPNAGTISVEPVAVAVNSVTDQIYVALSASYVIVLDGATNNTTQIATTPTASTEQASALAINPVTNKIYVGYALNLPSSNVVTEIDGSNNTETPIPVGVVPDAVAVNPITNQIYAANYNDDTVTIIDGATHASRTIPVGMNPAALVVNPITGSAYVMNLGQPNPGLNQTPVPGSVQTISEAAATAVISAGSDPFAVAVDPSLDKAYVANDGSNDVTVIDGRRNESHGDNSRGRQPLRGRSGFQHRQSLRGESGQ
jgi:YVTN family beta-propeller protein